MNVYFKKTDAKILILCGTCKKTTVFLSIFIYNICVLIKKEIPLHRFFEHYVNRILV